MSDAADRIQDLEQQIATLPTTESTPLPKWWSAQNAMTISSVTLAFGLFALLIVAWMMRKERSSDAILRAIGTVLVVFAALFLVVAGYSDSQIAPAFGLLGAIAGYLFGRTGSNSSDEPEGDTK